MKGRIFVAILVGTAVYGLLRYHGYFDGPHVQIQGILTPGVCKDKTIDLMVMAVGDSSIRYLLKKKISAELPFHQSKLDTYFRDRKARGDTSGFVMMGYLVTGRKLHCSGSTCFTVRQIKTLNEATFTEL